MEKRRFGIYPGTSKGGTLRHIGLFSHTPRLVNRALDMGVIDLVMFSINPGYDYRRGDYAIGSVDERAALYRRCEAEGVGISVMKAFSGGQLLNQRTSLYFRRQRHWFQRPKPAYSDQWRNMAGWPAIQWRNLPQRHDPVDKRSRP